MSGKFVRCIVIDSMPSGKRNRKSKHILELLELLKEHEGHILRIDCSTVASALNNRNIIIMLNNEGDLCFNKKPFTAVRGCSVFIHMRQELGLSLDKKRVFSRQRLRKGSYPVEFEVKK